MNALTHRLLDDAALFPPGNASMPDGVAAHLGYRGQPFADSVGPFVCPTSRLAELTAVLQTLPAAGRAPMQVSVIADADELATLPIGTADFDPGWCIAGIELRPVRSVGDLKAAAQLATLAPVFVEVARGPGADQALGAVADAGLMAKVRTGGVSRDAFPTELELAQLIRQAVTRGVPFKLTAGLHHAVRGRDPDTGFEHHGFLNVMLAVHSAQSGGLERDVAHELANRSSETVSQRVAGLGSDAVVEIRSAFRSFGTCSVADPLADLVELGLSR